MRLKEKILELLGDTQVEEIMYDGPTAGLKVVRKGLGLVQTEYSYGQEEAYAFVQEVSQQNGRMLSGENPVLDAVLPDGSRLNATIPPASRTVLITIRRFGDIKTIFELIDQGTLDVRTAAFIWMAVEGLSCIPANILIIGGTSTGKTTFLNTLSMFIPEKSRIITIEDTPELRLSHQNWVQLVAGSLSMSELVRNSLRMRPDRIFVGEVRGPEASAMFESMNTGHNGFIGTLHANDAKDCMAKLQNPPYSIAQSMLSNLNLVLTLRKQEEKRVLAQVTEIVGNSGQISFNELFLTKGDKLHETGIPSRLRARMSEAAGISVVEFDRIMHRRILALKQRPAPSSPNFILHHLSEKSEESRRKRKFRLF